MDVTQEIGFGDTSAVLALYPPDWAEGVPSSATVKVYLGDGGDLNTEEWSAAVTVDSVNLSTNGASSASGKSQALRRRLYLTSTVGLVVGRWYRLADEVSGRVEFVQVVAIGATFVELRDPLAHDYPAAATTTLKGLRMIAAVDTTWVATEGKLLAGEQVSYRAIWTYTVAGTVRKHPTDLRLVRQARRHNVKPADLQPYYPDIKLNEPRDTRGQQLLEAIQAGYLRVRADHRQIGLRVEQIRDPEIFDDLVRAAALMISASWATPPGWTAREWAEHTAQAYAGLFSRTVAAGGKVYLDVGTTGAADGKAPGTYWFQS